MASIKLKLTLGGIRPSAPSTPTPATNRANGSGNATPAESSSSRLPSEGPSSAHAPPLSIATPISGTPSEASTPEGAPPKRKRSRPRKHTLPMPTAIPPHVASPAPRARSPSVKLEHDDDPLASWALSPNADYGTPMDTSTPATPWREGSEDMTTFATRKQWKRVKKPFRELANKILAEMRRKDEYGFFLEPVDVDEYPGYIETIGGPDNAMDLGTMQRKIDSGEYHGIEELEADARRMHAAAHAFNLPGTAAYREADKVFKHGMKHIERSRPLVLTPTPSLSPSARPSHLPDSERATPGRRGREIKPEHLIPEVMLEFPANSLQAKAVGWNLTGGRRVRAKRLVRGREKFSGKWRDMLPDGSFDVAEMDDPADMFEHLRTRKASSWTEVPDWVGMGEGEEEWWDWDGPGGPTGQPPLPGAARLKPNPLKMKRLDLQWGRFDEVNADISKARLAALPEGRAMPHFTEQDDVELLASHLRPDAPRARPGLPAQNFVDVNAGQPASCYLSDLALGDVRGEAYAASVRRFMAGIKTDPETHADLTSYVEEKWHEGVLQSRLSRIARDTANTLATDPASLSETARAAYARLALRRLTSAENPLDLQPLLREPADFGHTGVGGKGGVQKALKWVSDEIDRVVRERAELGEKLEAGLLDGDGDIAMAFMSEHNANGKRGADGLDVKDAKLVKRIKLEGDVKRESHGEAANGDAKPEPTPDGEDGLRALRLELVALSKFYPLASLKKMDAADAARLLPSNVRNLMTRPAAK
ncbi:hypothetical protein CC85DRAFT_287345 [Cutaneotrichosporon oleaginosum]|uniref:Bromo domain-containing protein n=1 Tax=Cutaneotrichosporon oleaginosum TaxID=879819 RepID=A0A0J1AYU9_9TREE|nr:uncharacterized protein CC85DRAFT_287345 [Cutaneotrichosporon oleaginosum]KLT40499.1 hypothetical protein CC85DRAFT_287345 [Cutaneotrichosporon oleaginosum]TXT08429.1 hypothetical protein COLE_05353 [Cutaneotrichosporon oleaginosum]